MTTTGDHFAPIDYGDPLGDDDPSVWETIDHETGEIVNESTALAELDQAWIAYGEIRTPRQALDLSNKAATIAYYLKRSGAELQVQNRAATVKLLSEYKAGRLLKEMPKAQGIGTPGIRNSVNRSHDVTTLSDLGITKMQSFRLQTLAELEEDEMRGYISETAEHNREITTAGAVARGKAKKRSQKRAAHEAQAQAEPTKPRLWHASWDTWLAEQPDCDLLITDPPYSTDVEDIDTFAAEWLPVALSAVKPTGRAYVCIGAYPDELRAYLNADRAGMTLAQVLVWVYRNTKGPAPKLDYQLINVLPTTIMVAAYPTLITIAGPR